MRSHVAFVDCRASRRTRLKRFEEFEQCHPVGLAETGAVFMATVGVARQTRVEGEGTGKGATGFDPDMYRVKFPAADIKDLRPLCRWEQKIVKTRHRTIV